MSHSNRLVLIRCFHCESVAVPIVFLVVLFLGCTCEDDRIQAEAVNKETIQVESQSAPKKGLPINSMGDGTTPSNRTGTTSAGDRMSSNSGSKVARYFLGAEVQCEEGDSCVLVESALRDILELGEEELKDRRYSKTKKDEGQLTLAQVIYKHIVPADERSTLGSDFFREIRSSEVQKIVKEILTQWERERSR